MWTDWQPAKVTQSPIPNRLSPRITIIVAMAKNRVIGAGNKLPWHLSADLKRFKALTMGHHIIMGRKTWESFGRLLPGRHHVIVSRQPGYGVAGAQVVHSLDAAIAACAGDDELFVIGGGEIYRQALPVTDRIYLTEIGREFDGDTRFPELDKAVWRLTERTPGSSHDIDYAFCNYDRVSGELRQESA